MSHLGKSPLRDVFELLALKEAHLVPGTLTLEEHLCFLQASPRLGRPHGAGASLIGTLHTGCPGSEASPPEQGPCRATGCILGQVSDPLRASVSQSVRMQHASA